MIRWLCLLVFFLSGCGSFLGGGHYEYRYQSPEGRTVYLAVDSTREFPEGLHITLSPDGTVQVDTRAIKPGPDVLSEALKAVVEAAYGG